MMSKKLKNKNVFYLILAFLPLFVLLLLEILLRIFGFGNSYPLFIPAKALPGYLQTNPNIIKRYFNHSELAPNIKPDTAFFSQQKPTDSFRIVIQGGSTAAGFPFGRFGSLQGMLQQRFKRLYPDKKIEVISTAMSAINSYTLLDFTDEIIEIQPDLVLIYAGHNEYVGIMGVGSTFAAKGDRAATLIFLKLKELRLFQLMQEIIGFFQQTPSQAASGKNTTDKRTLMAKIAKKKDIPIDGELFMKGVEQFSGNLELLLAKYRHAKIPVMISTLASNEKDQPPFSSAKSEDSAIHYYQAAKTFEQLGKIEQAIQAYIKAKDHDLLRFRAPSQFNQIIRNNVGSGVILVDSEQRIRDDSENGIIGYQHMFEHLHPNARGYFMLSEAFVDKIISEKIIATTHKNFPSNYAWKDIPLTHVDLITANFKIKKLTSDYPFKKSNQPVSFGKAQTFEDKMALKILAGQDWLESQKQMLDYYQKTKSNDNLNNNKEAAKVAGLIFDAFPNQHKTAWVAGQLYFSIKDIQLALFYHLRAVELKPTEIRYLMSAAYSLYVNQRISGSLAMLNRILEIDPKHSQALKQKNRLELMIDKN